MSKSRPKSKTPAAHPAEFPEMGPADERPFTANPPGEYSPPAETPAMETPTTAAIPPAHHIVPPPVLIERTVTVTIPQMHSPVGRRAVRHVDWSPDPDTGARLMSLYTALNEGSYTVERERGKPKRHVGTVNDALRWLIQQMTAPVGAS